MGKINYKAIYDKNKDDWKAMTREPQKYEELLAGHYSDCNHFIYELLQNAEDAFEVDENGKFNPETCAFADKVVIEYYEDKLVFYHNGKPFDEDDVIGISSLTLGTKEKSDGETIGRFGMGFKSVYKYTNQPEIYSDNEAFRIVDFLLPIEIENGWDYKEEINNNLYELKDGKMFAPLFGVKHLTKIIIPFTKHDEKGMDIRVDGKDILYKLQYLDENTLLFLSHIKYLFWIDMTNKDKYGLIKIQIDKEDPNLVICTENTSERYVLDRCYLKYTEKYNLEEMSNAEVSIAYPLDNNRKKIDIRFKKETIINVYFPTEDYINVPFLVHGSFDTSVSREKLIKPSKFNNKLMSYVSDLIASSLLDLARRNLITQEFIRNVLIPIFDEKANGYILSDLKNKVINVFKENEILPDSTGKYRKTEKLVVAVPFELSNFTQFKITEKILKKRKFVAFNNEYYPNFSDYYDFIVNGLNIPIYSLKTFMEDCKELEGKSITKNGKEFSDLKGIYKILERISRNFVVNNYVSDRYNTYNSELKQQSESVLTYLRKCPLVLSRSGVLKPVVKEQNQYLYIQTDDSPIELDYGEYISNEYTSTDIMMIENIFNIPRKNHWNDIKNIIKRKYIEIDDYIKFDDEDNSDKEYVKDIRMLSLFVLRFYNSYDIKSFLENAYIIRIVDDDGDISYSKPSMCLVQKSVENLDFHIYFKNIDDKLNEDDRFYKVDWEFYKKNGIDASIIEKFGLKSSIVDDGEITNFGDGDDYWRALGDYCPKIKIIGLTENLEYIEEHSNEKLARQKSRELLKLLMKIANKLVGKKQKRLKRNPYISDIEEADILKYEIKRYKWLYDEKYKLRRTCEISRFELNDDLYSNVQISKDGAAVLGFIEKNLDIADDMKNKFATFSKKEQQDFLSSIIETYGVDKIKNIYEEDDVYFDVDSYNDVDFPVRKVTNKEYLKQHILEQFYCADPVRYEKVIRKTRVSKKHKVDRAYAIGMYTNKTGKIVCQGCKKTTNYVDVVQLSNYGIEMPQFSLCLCKDCATKFKEIRSEDKSVFKNQIKEKVMDININNDDEYIIDVSEDMKLNFTQTHIMELQEIFDMINQYGIPSNSDNN